MHVLWDCTYVKPPLYKLSAVWVVTWAAVRITEWAAVLTPSWFISGFQISFAIEITREITQKVTEDEQRKSQTFESNQVRRIYSIRRSWRDFVPFAELSLKDRHSETNLAGARPWLSLMSSLVSYLPSSLPYSSIVIEKPMFLGKPRKKITWVSVWAAVRKAVWVFLWAICSIYLHVNTFCAKLNKTKYLRLTGLLVKVMYENTYSEREKNWIQIRV